MDLFGFKKRAGIPAYEEVMNNIDLVALILIHLPALCLLRLKLTCKEWCLLIERNSFCDEHTEKHFLENTVMALYGIRRPILKLCKLPNQLITKGLPMLWFLLGKSSVSTRKSLRQLERQQKKINLLTSTNGLMLCLIDNRLFVVNPTTQTSRDIGVAKSEWRISHHISFNPSVSRFYKVIRIVTHFHGFQGPASFEIDIYSSATHQWKNIKIDELYRPNIMIPHVLVKGIVYWMTADTNSLLTFDVADEVMSIKETIFRILDGDICWSGEVNNNWFVVEKDSVHRTTLHIYKMNLDNYPMWTPVVDVNMRPMLDAMTMEGADVNVISLKEEIGQVLPSVVFVISNRIITFNTLNDTFNVVREMAIDDDYDPTAPLDVINAPYKAHKFIPTLANV